MLFQRTKAPLRALVFGLCLSVLSAANAQSAAVEVFSVTVPGSVATQPLPDVPITESTPRFEITPSDVSPPAATAQRNVPMPTQSAPLPGTVRVALLLPLRSPTLGRAADAVRDGFLTAYERERDGVEVTLFDTSDAAEDVLAGYRAASAQHDIVVGPLTRTGVTALARSGEVLRPTIALTSPDFADGLSVRPPPLMLAMGLSMEDEARQIAHWASRNHGTELAVVVHTQTEWQRRAARAFLQHWSSSGMAARTFEVEMVDGFLSAESLAELRTLLEQESAPILFAALDAGQALQLRESVGRQHPMYGTSQLNPIALPDRPQAAPMPELEGVHLLDMPWQLQADHPAVMTYPRQRIEAEQRRNADLERLYALGIDAYRVARQIAAGRGSFELDGVTGHLQVRFDQFGPHFERTAQHAVYQDGAVTLPPPVH